MVKSSRGRVIRLIFVGFLWLVAVANLLIGASWYLSLGIAVAGGFILLGGRRIFRAAVTRSGDEVVCRYIPWYEGNAYSGAVLLPLMGIVAVGAGFAPGNPAWLRFAGFTLLAVFPVALWGLITMWRKCLLRITPTGLTVRLAEGPSGLIDISREQVVSIEPNRAPAPVVGESLQAEIAYRTADSGHETTKVLLGFRLTVEPTNLVDALIVWRNGGHDDPRQLMDQIEQILDGRSTTVSPS